MKIIRRNVNISPFISILYITNCNYMEKKNTGIKLSYKEDTRKFFGQQCQDEKLNKKFRKFHEDIVNQIIGFCKDNDIIIDEFSLSDDGLEGSIEKGSWQACTDSSFSFRKFDDDYKKAFKECDQEFYDQLKAEGKDVNKVLNEIVTRQEPFMYSV